ncbi:MAG: AraC family transcriptional regulator [Cyanobacteria bacterium P01_H01_bin.58]
MAKSQAKLWRVQALNDVECLKAVGINHAFGRHIHAGFGLAIVDQGRLAYRTEAGDHFLKPGDVLVINPGQVHWGGTVDGDRYSYRIVYPDCETVARAIPGPEDSPLPYFANNQIYNRPLARRIQHLLTALEAEPITLAQETYLTTVLAELVTHHADRTADPLTLENQIVQRTRDYIEAFYPQNLSLTELANLAQMKPLRLLRTFRKAMGLPPHAYLLQVRIHHAKAQLAQGQAIADVAINTGFADQSHFTRHFKRFMGVTPGQYVSGQ